MLKTSTKQLIQSFKLRDIKPQCIRNDVAFWHRWCHQHGSGRREDIALQISLLPMRQHMSQLLTT